MRVTYVLVIHLRTKAELRRKFHLRNSNFLVSRLKLIETKARGGRHLPDNLPGPARHDTAWALSRQENSVVLYDDEPSRNQAFVDVLRNRLTDRRRVTLFHDRCDDPCCR